MSLNALPAYGQGSTTSTITGTVVDTSGGVLPGATVTAKHLATNVTSTSTTNSGGAFTIASLVPGTYEVTVALDGFKTFIVQDVALSSFRGRSPVALVFGSYGADSHCHAGTTSTSTPSSRSLSD